MRAATSYLVIGGVVMALSAGGLAAAAQAMRAKPLAAVADAEPVVVPSQSEIDAERRARLGARMHTMVRDGTGGRLTDAPAPRAARAVTPAPRPSPAVATRRATEVVSDRPESSTIRPPAFNPASTPARSAGGRYVAPRLDLRTMPAVPSDPVECLTQAIYYEARNESEDGQAAVAEVVMNRSRSGAYPRPVCAVVYQRNSRTCQFTFTCDGAIGRHAVDMRKWARAERIARDVYEGRSATVLPKNSVNYHADYVRPSWGARLERVRQIGAHIFYGASRNGRATPGAAATASAERAPAAQGLVFVRIPELDRASSSPADGS